MPERTNLLLPLAILGGVAAAVVVSMRRSPVTVEAEGGPEFAEGGLVTDSGGTPAETVEPFEDVLEPEPQPAPAPAPEPVPCYWRNGRPCDAQETLSWQLTRDLTSFPLTSFATRDDPETNATQVNYGGPFEGLGDKWTVVFMRNGIPFGDNLANPKIYHASLRELGI